MEKNQKKPINSASSKGSVLVLTALLVTFFIGMAALAIDIGYLSTTRNELQNTADAAALAGAGYLGITYNTLAVSQQGTYVFDKADIVSVVQAVALENKAARLGITIINDEFDIKIGTWDDNACNEFTDPKKNGWNDCDDPAADPNKFTGEIEPQPQGINATYTRPTAVSVIARRDKKAGSDKPISTFFAGVLGIDEMPVSAIAVASLLGPVTTGVGELQTPFGLSENLFPDHCSDTVSFSPSTSSCAGWHNFGDKIDGNLEAKKLINIIEGAQPCEACDSSLSDGDVWLANNFTYDGATPVVTPSKNVGDIFPFQGGAIAKLMTGVLLDSDYDTGLLKGEKGTVIKTNGDEASNINNPMPMMALFDYFRYRDGDGDVLYEENVFAENDILYEENIYDEAGDLLHAAGDIQYAAGTLLHAAGEIKYAKDDVWSTTVPVYKDALDPPNCMNPNTSLEIVDFARIKIIAPNPPPATDINVEIDCSFITIRARGGGGPGGTLIGQIPSLVK